MNEVWKAALAERGDRAFELFEERWKQKGLNPSYFKNNEGALDALNSDMGFSLKPLDKLIQLDIERYGKWAVLMYEWQYKDNGTADWVDRWFDCDRPISFKPTLNYRRKLYANAPFNVEWARAGVAVEWYCGDLKKPVIDFEVLNEVDFLAIGKIDGEYNQFYVSEHLRHPFPPIKEV